MKTKRQIDQLNNSRHNINFNFSEADTEQISMKTKRQINQLNNSLHNINFNFSETDTEQILKINNFPPIFFNKNAGGKIQKGSCNWMRNKHKNGSLHEPSTISAFSFIQQNFANQINVIFDIGALYGYFSLISKSMFPQATVFSFEMNPESYSALVNNINCNKHLGIPTSRCINMGLSNNTSLQKKVFCDKFTLIEDGESENLAQIDIMSIDDFCRISGFFPDLIKLDVEGYQAKILSGGENIIEKNKPIILLEFDGQKQLKRFDTTNKQITKFLFDLGYSCYWCKDQRTFQGEFQKLDYDKFTQEHEVNSLSIFLPN